MDERRGQSAKHELLFISYGSEDRQFTQWLDRKLTLFGYRPWTDYKGLLGGETFGQAIPDVIRDKTFKVLAVCSKTSIKKPDPTAERMLAYNVGRQRNDPDFLIPINLDGLRPEEFDLSTVGRTYVPFHWGWAAGLDALLKKLRAIDAPRRECVGDEDVFGTLGTEAPLVAMRPELLTSNLLPILRLPTVLYRFEVLGGTSLLELTTRWPHASIRKTKSAWAFYPPPDGVQYRVECSAPWSPTATNEQVRNTGRYVLRRCIELHALGRGLGQVVTSAGERMFFPKGLLDRDKIFFLPGSGKRTHLKVVGDKVSRQDPSRVLYRYHLAPSFRFWQIADDGFFVAVGAQVHLTNAKGEPLGTDAAVTKRKKICKQWFNDKWRRVTEALAFWYTDGQPVATLFTYEQNSLAVAGGLIKVEAPVALDEAALASRKGGKLAVQGREDETRQEAPS